MQVTMTRRAGVALFAATIWMLATACGGGGDTPTTPTPPSDQVLRVDVSPGSATLTLPGGSIQLQAVARNQQLAPIPGLTFNWGTSAPQVATVTQGGLVTAVGVGQAVITASAGGQTGSALITVTGPQVPTNPYGPVVDRKEIGPAGGTVGNADVAITIPAGAFTTTRTVQLVRDTVLPDPYAAGRTGARYLVDGMPAGQSVPVRVRIRATASGTGTPAIGTMRPAFVQGSDLRTELGLTLHEATDSAGFLVATVPIAGRPASWGPPGGGIAGRVLAQGGAFDWFGVQADAIIGWWSSYSVALSASGRFAIWGLNSVDPQMARKVQRAATMMDEAYATLTGSLGYSLAHRTVWPMQVLLEQAPPNEGGAFVAHHPWPFDTNTTYIQFNVARVDEAEFPGVTIHELFHLVQLGYRVGRPWPEYTRSRWLAEATSSWVEIHHPSDPVPYPGSVARSWRDSLFGAMNSAMVANSGYGKAPMIRYIAKRYGNDRIRSIWTAVGAGTHPVTALLNAVPEPPAQWWPQMLAEHFGGSLYPWTVPQMLNTASVPLTPGRLALTYPDLGFLETRHFLLQRDTAAFGPDFRLPVYLEDTVSRTKARLIVLEKPAAATHFRPIAGGDTTFIPGHRLQTTDSLLVVVMPTSGAEPYNNRMDVKFRIDLRLPDGDWRATSVTGVTGAFASVCTKPGDSVKVNVAENAISIWNVFANAGTWKREPTASWPATYRWVVDPALADSVAMLGMRLESTLRETEGDTIRATARFRWGGDAASMARMARMRSGVAPDELGWWWIGLVPFALVPVARSRRLRRVVPGIGAALLLTLVACDIGTISFEIDETLDFTFRKVRYNVNPARPDTVQMELRDGAGRSTLTTYKTEYWSYVYDEQGAKVDSTRQTCNASGTVPYTVQVNGYVDGWRPPDDGDDDLQRLVERITGADARRAAMARQRSEAMRR